MYIPRGEKELRTYMAGRSRSISRIDGISRPFEEANSEGEGDKSAAVHYKTDGISKGCSGFASAAGEGSSPEEGRIPPRTLARPRLRAPSSRASLPDSGAR